MGAVKKQVYNEQLMAGIDYSSPTKVKNAIKGILQLEGLASKGDTVALSIMVDLKNALGLYNRKPTEVMTPKQQFVVLEVYINDLSQSDVADKLGLTQQGVSYLLNSGVERVYRFLKTGKDTWKPLSDAEKKYLLDNYGKIPVRVVADKLNRSVNSCAGMYHRYRERGDGVEQAEGHDVG